MCVSHILCCMWNAAHALSAHTIHSPDITPAQAESVRSGPSCERDPVPGITPSATYFRRAIVGRSKYGRVVQPASCPATLEALHEASFLCRYYSSYMNQVARHSVPCTQNAWQRATGSSHYHFCPFQNVLQHAVPDLHHCRLRYLHFGKTKLQEVINFMFNFHQLPRDPCRFHPRRAVPCTLISDLAGSSFASSRTSSGSISKRLQVVLYSHNGDDIL